MTNLINKESNNIFFEKNILYIESIDRDINKWPNSNEFEIFTPQKYNNVVNMKILNIQFPTFYFNVCEKLQNNKFCISFSNLNNILTLEDGFYNNIKMESTLRNLLRTELDPSFNVKYNEINNKYYFAHEDKSFNLIFDNSNIDISYSNCSNKIFDQHSFWGLGFNLGFNKENYEARNNIQNNDNDINFLWDNCGQWITGSNIHLIKSPNFSTLNNKDNIYLEIDKYNNCDELIPYYNNYFTNENNGKINSAITKIPTTVFFGENNTTTNYGYYEPTESGLLFKEPINNVSKLKFKFRYHNNLLVDFFNQNVALTLEITQLKAGLNNLNKFKNITIT